MESEEAEAELDDEWINLSEDFYVQSKNTLLIIFSPSIP